MDTAPKQPPPKTVDEYNERYQLNSKIDGFGLDVTMTLACPFCAAPGWATYYVLKDMEAVLQNENVCAECGRGCVAVYSRSTDGAQVSMRMYQTRGDDPPSFMPAMQRRDRPFPVHPEDRRDCPEPHSVPWAWLAQYERRAIENHDQSLEKLASRGGLGWHEIIAIVRGARISKYREIAAEFPNLADAQKHVLEMVAKWKAAG